MTRLFSYVVTRDYGFAPNPFGGFCTVACCKPTVRRVAQVGDYIVGTASTTKFPPGQVVYVMRVSEILSFDQFWNDPRFELKRPILNATRKRQYGDNIYCTNSQGEFIQMDSHHSLAAGATNTFNLNKDTSVDRVLVSDCYTYWGGSGPVLPAELHYTLARRGHRSKFTDDEVAAFVRWAEPLLGQGFCGRPFSWA